MVAVMVDSRNDGETGWVATRGLPKVSVKGISGCEVELNFVPESMPLVVKEDGVYDLPEGTEFLMSRHSKTNGSSRVFVDLVR